jgi:hypothetical protein
MQHLRVMKEDYVYGHCVFMLRKASPYMRSINSIVHKVRDTGLVLYWEDLTVRRYMSTRRQLAVMNSRKEVDSCPIQLKLRHVTVSICLSNKQTNIPSNTIICLLQHSYMFWSLAILLTIFTLMNILNNIVHAGAKFLYNNLFIVTFDF